MFRLFELGPSFFILTFIFALSVNLQAQTDIFLEYPWLTDEVDPSDCDGEKITEYDLGSFAFVVVEKASEEFLYFETGQLFCTGSSSFSCVQAYGFSSNQIGLEFECTNSSTNMQSACDSDVIAENLLNEFPWLDTYVNFENCTDESVIVFQNGVHKYLAVRSPVVSQFFYQDGSVLCNNSASFDCATAYGFNDADIITQFTCGQGGSFCVNGVAVSGIYTFDFLSFGLCQFWDEEVIDLIGLDDNCYINPDGLERCLEGEIKIDDDGSFAFGYTSSGQSVNGGIEISGGSGSGTLVEEDGAYLTCYNNGECMPANLDVSLDRISFDVEIEGCPVRIGGYR